MKNLYIIYDNVGEAFVGRILVFAHDAPAIRDFYDILADPNPNPLNRHPDNYELRCIGAITDDGQLVTDAGSRTVTTGTLWLAAQTATSTSEA